jgi:hypothetical protein
MGASEEGTRSVFVDPKGRPRLARCAVLFLDILGVSEMALDRCNSAQNLIDLDRALRRTSRDFLADDSPWPSALLSDSLIVTDPTGPSEDDTFVLEEMLIQTAILQLQLAASGFFARGALTIGDMHIHDGMVFGPGLVEAYRLERDWAISPRVVLGQAACEILRTDMTANPAAVTTTQSDLLIVDQDGVVFIDYLKMLFDEFDPVNELEIHRAAVETKLAAHRDESRKWEKYRWIAEYHNHFCERALDGGPLIPEGETAMQLKAFS